MTKHDMGAWPAAGPSRAPYWIYDDPEVFRLEQERIFGRSWCYVGLEAEVPEPGSFKRSNVGDRSVLLVRDKEGGINVLENRCAHRGMEFCRESAGHANRFMCPYHQWSFDLTGNLCGVPFKKGIQGEGGMPADFRVGDHPLRKLRVAPHHGVVFASYAEEPEPFASYLDGPMRALFDRVFDGRPLRVLGYMRQRIPCNWKLILENTKDPYHATLLHSFLVTFGLFRADQRSEVKLDASGRHAALVSRHGGRKLSVVGEREMASYKREYALQDRRLIDIQPEYTDGIGVVMMTLYPNLILQQQGNSLATRHIVPRGPDSTDLTWTFFGYGTDDEEMVNRRLRQANLFGPSGLVSLDDGEVLKATQEGLRNGRDACAVVEMGGRGCEDANVMVTETALRGFFHHYMHVMGFDTTEEAR
jgi:salicylate 5-hydroxylase large subunit